MRSSYPVDIAAHAANLSERIQVVSILDAAGGQGGQGGQAGQRCAQAAPVQDHDPELDPELDPFEAWRIEHLAAKLAKRFEDGTGEGPVPAEHTREGLVRVLGAYHRHELSLSLTGADGRAGRVLRDVHRQWLPTYEAALDGFDLSPHAMPDAGWRRFEVYYGRLAKVCEPFLLELGRRLAEARDGLAEVRDGTAEVRDGTAEVRDGTAEARDGTADPAEVRISAQVLEDIQTHFLDRFELLLAWAVETDAKVYCSLQGMDRAQATRDDYLAYLDKTFTDAESYHRFYLDFPVLGRWLAHLTDLLARHGRQLITRLCEDGAELSEAFFRQPITEVRSVRLGCSDQHAGARSVAIVEVGLADGGTGRLVHKPRCVRSEAALQGLLRRLRDDGVVGFADRAVLPRDGYGYEALIPSGRNRVQARAEAEHIYRELGGYLALFYVLGGGDLHFENILVADGHAFVCDCETVLGAPPQGSTSVSGTLMDSVFRTGLIEWPTAPVAAGADTGPKISGYSGGEAYEVPFPVPQINDRRLSFDASVTFREGVRVEGDAANRVFLDGRLTRAEDFADAIRDGFDRVYQWFERRPEAAIRCVSGLFAGSRVRFVNWSTQVYAGLLTLMRHPKCLMEPLQVDVIAGTVRTFPRRWDHDGILPAWELEAMWRLDVPLFTVEAGDDRLTHDQHTPVPVRLAAAPLDHAATRIRRLSPRNRAQQNQYIAAGLSSGEVASPAFTATSIEHACRVGEWLCQMLRQPDGLVPWAAHHVAGDNRVEPEVEADLYHGAAGIALFLAYLDDMCPRPEFRRAARRALAHAVAHCDRQRIGAFRGVSGLVYLLTHLHRLWGDRELLDQAVRLSRELTGRIDDDRHLDVLSGVAGVIPVMLGLARAADGDGLECAHRCASHLLRHAQADGETLSWPHISPDDALANLTGLSHGAAGIGWSLITLGRFTDRPEYVSAGRRAFSYESRHFDENERDWYDLRRFSGGVAGDGHHFANAWCNGAAGIGLTRIDSWARLGGDDDALLAEARQALTATVRNFPRLRNDTLCHGRSGNAELLLRFAVLKREPAFRIEANVHVQAQWLNFETEQPPADCFTGLMIGLAGFGMHFLRLARPEHVPSVLLLDPPVTS